MSFEEWYSVLQAMAEMAGESVADVEAWREDFEAGKGPEDAFFDEYPEHEE